MRFRAITAALILFGYGATSVEVVLGELRDGEVHHESALAAAQHDVRAQGEHGHEEPVADTEHGPDHQHGTAADHCTHTHSVSLPSGSGEFQVVALEGTQAARPVPVRTGVFKAPLLHPPRA